MSMDTLEKAEKYIPADVRLISGCLDAQTSADVSNVADFQLPDPAGSAGGACTSAMLQVLYSDHHDTSEDLTFQEVMLKIRDNLSENFSQVGLQLLSVQVHYLGPKPLTHTPSFFPNQCLLSKDTTTVQFSAS
jgi:hypothetical protein